MLAKKYRNFKQSVIKLLIEKNNYEDDVDDKMIDELVYNFYLVDEAKKKIKDEGIVVNVRAEGKIPYYQTSVSLGIYNYALKNITTIYTKLGINGAERKKLKISGSKEADIFDDIDE